MASLLAIEATGHLCSVALLHDGQVSQRHEAGSRSHSQHLLPFIEELLVAQSLTVQQLSGIAFAAGPGSFTGVRLAASVAKALGFAANLPVITVSSLASMAQAHYRRTGSTTPCRVLLDARMEEFYVGEYALGADGLVVASQEDRLLPVASLASLPAGFDEVREDALAEDVITLALPKLLSGDTRTGLSAQPVYLRGQSAWKNLEQQRQS